MNMTSVPRLRCLATAALAICVGVPATGLHAQDPAASLVELARQEQKRRTTVKTGSHVYSDKDLARPADAPPSAAATAPAIAPDQKPAAKPEPKDPNEKDEAWWRGRITQAREAQRRGETFRNALQSQINALATDSVNRDDPYQRAKAGQDRQKAADELTRVTAEVDAAKKEIVAIEEEARQAGAPPGWLR
jgi:hypothetical protein